MPPLHRKPIRVRYMFCCMDRCRNIYRVSFEYTEWASVDSTLPGKWPYDRHSNQSWSIQIYKYMRTVTKNDGLVVLLTGGTKHMLPKWSRILTSSGGFVWFHLFIWDSCHSIYLFVCFCPDLLFLSSELILHCSFFYYDYVNDKSYLIMTKFAITVLFFRIWLKSVICELVFLISWTPYVCFRWRWSVWRKCTLYRSSPNVILCPRDVFSWVKSNITEISIWL